MSSWTQKSPTAVNGTPFPPPSPQKNPITAVFGDQQDYSVSKEKQSGPICCPSAAGVTSCNKSLISPSHLYLLRYIPHYFLKNFSPCAFFPLLFFPFTSCVLFHQKPVGGAHAQRAAIFRRAAENREETLWVVVTFEERSIFASLAHSLLPPLPSSHPPLLPHPWAK